MEEKFEFKENDVGFYAVLDMARESGVNFTNAKQISMCYFCSLAFAMTIFYALYH